MFLVGAYQEILGDLHNLFGDTNAVHVSLDANGDARLDTLIKGDTASPRPHGGGRVGKTDRSHGPRKHEEVAGSSSRPASAGPQPVAVVSSPASSARRNGGTRVGTAH